MYRANLAEGKAMGQVKIINIEGLIDENHHLILDEELTVDGPQRVSVSIKYEEKKKESDLSKLPLFSCGKRKMEVTRENMYGDDGR